MAIAPQRHHWMLKLVEDSYQAMNRCLQWHILGFFGTKMYSTAPLNLTFFAEFMSDVLGAEKVHM